MANNEFELEKLTLDELTNDQLERWYKRYKAINYKKLIRPSYKLGKKGSGSLRVEINSSGVYFYYVYKKDKNDKTVYIDRHSMSKNQSGIMLSDAIDQANIFAKHNLSGTLDRYLDELSRSKIEQEAAKEAARQAADQKILEEVKNKGLVTFRHLIVWYRDEVITEKGDSYSDVNSAFNKHILNKEEEHKGILEKPARDITTEDIRAIMRSSYDGYGGKKRPILNRLRSYMHAAFSQAKKYYDGDYTRDQEYYSGIKHNPVEDISIFSEVEKVGKMQLTDREIWLLWHFGVQEMNFNLGYLIKLLFACGGIRQKEMMSAEWNRVDIDFDPPNIAVIVKKVGNTKKKKKLTKEKRINQIPFTKLALEEIKKVKESTGHCKYIFPQRKGSGAFIKDKLMVQSFDKRIKKFHKFIVENYGQDPARKITLGMIRSTLTTRMSEAQCSKEIVMRIQGHTVDKAENINNSTTNDIVYNQNQFLKEKLEELEKWEKKLRAIIELPYEQVTDRLPENQDKAKNVNID